MKKIFITIIAMLLPLMASADANGTCGENLTWSYVTSTKTLTISGTGEMTNYSYSNAPWNSFKSSIKNIIIKSGVTSIGNYVFFGCSSLTSITIPNSVTSVGGSAFSGCSGLTYITIPSSVTSIGDRAFVGCSGLTSITIPNSVTSIGHYAFLDCSSLTSVTIGNSVTSIGSEAFDNCRGLTSVYITDLEAWCKINFKDDYSNPVYFAKHLFLNGEEIKDLVIPSNLTSIKQFTFEYCTGLTSVTIPNSVTSILFGAFSGCSGLTSVYITDLEAWCKIDFYDYGSNPVYYAKHLFLNGEEIKDLVIPNSVTSIGYDAFRNCSGLTSITIPNSVASIGGSAFEGCSGLTSVSIPNSVESIGSYAFDGCSGLTSITIPNSVTNIGESAFSGCSGLTSIVSLNNTPPTCIQDYYGNYTQFNSIDKANCIVWVPRGSANAYKDADGWKDFQNIRELALGDVNIDFEVNQADLDATTNHIMGQDQEGFYESLADLNNDEAVDAADVVKLVTILNIQDGLSLDWDYSYNSSQMVSSLSCTLNNDGDKTIQLTKCELYNNNKLVMGSNFKVTLAPGESKSRTFSDLASLSVKTGFSVVWYYTYNGESYTYNCDLTE